MNSNKCAKFFSQSKKKTPYGKGNEKKPYWNSQRKFQTMLTTVTRIEQQICT